MKIYKILIIIYLGGLSLFSYGQNKKNDDLYYSNDSKTYKNDCPKYTNKLIIKTQFNKDDNFMKVGQTIIDNNFEIDTKDKDFYTITTKQKFVNGTDAYVINFTIKDSVIIVIGKIINTATIDLFKSGVQVKGQYFRVEKRNSGPFGKAFNEMYALIEKIGGEIECITEDIDE